MQTATKQLPHARTTGLIVKPLGNEVMVYDTDRNTAHCLNHTAALVWKQCDGQHTVDQVAQNMSAELHATVSPDVVWYALRQLDRFHLLSESVTAPANVVALSRRDFARTLGKAAVAIAIPVIISMTAPNAARAASCLPSGAACSAGAQCCSGICNVNTCT